MTEKNVIHLGYEIGTGNAVAVPLLNLAVTGQTQESGKTTTLEALASRSGAKVITFVTKRGEGSFADGRRIHPYFRDRADWQFVDAILEAALGEKNKFLRQFLIPICRTTKTLAEVQAAVRRGLQKAKGVKEGALVQLDAYLELIVPDIARAHLAPSIDLQLGLNVMDVSDFSTPMQMLFVQSALDWVNERERNTVVVIPEAWEFIPEGKGSPVKSSAIKLVRKGSGIGNRIWVDSQDMAGVDKTILRGCPVWLIGVQREINEIKRNIANIPPPTGKPKPGDVAMLQLGEFFACFGKTLAKVYVQPAWMCPDDALSIATGFMSIDEVREHICSKPMDELTGAALSAPDPAEQHRVNAFRTLPPPKPWIYDKSQEDEVTKEEADTLRAENERLKSEVEVADQSGFERGMTAGLRQAGEFWNAAMLDVRDVSRAGAGKLADLTEHLAELARDGRWSVPRGAAKPEPIAGDQKAVDPPLVERPASKPKPAPAASGATTSGVDLSMLRPLVRSHPQSLTAERWGLFLGLSAGTTKSGPWHKKVRALIEAGYIEKTGNGFRATAAGIGASSEAPENPQDAVALWQLWRNEIRDLVGDAAIGLLRVLAIHRKYRLTNEQLALLAGKSAGTAKSGPWFTILKTLREWDLIEGDRIYAITEKGRTIIPEGKAPAASDTAEALRQARYARLEVSKRHYDALLRPMTKKELGGSMGMTEGTMKSGPWHGAIKELVVNRLVIDQSGQLRRVEEELATA